MGHTGRKKLEGTTKTQKLNIPNTVYYCTAVYNANVHPGQPRRKYSTTERKEFRTFGNRKVFPSLLKCDPQRVRLHGSTATSVNETRKGLSAE